MIILLRASNDDVISIQPDIVEAIKANDRYQAKQKVPVPVKVFQLPEPVVFGDIENLPYRTLKELKAS